MSQSLGARILGIGRNLPPRILTNAELEKRIDTSDEWITTRTGIRERRIADDDVTTADLAIPAAVEALENAGVTPADLDLILCATSTPDKMFPSTACMIQKGIGAGQSPAFDLLAACSGFTYGLKIADCFIRSGSADNVLLVGSEIYHRIIDWTDRKTCVLFGDAAACVVLSKSDGQSGIVDSAISSDGNYADLLCAGGAAANNSSPNATCGDNSRYLRMKGKETFKVAVKKMSDISKQLLSSNGFTADDLDLVIPHQANIRIINAIGKNLGLEPHKLFVNIEKYGNTSAASVPLALYEAMDEGKLKQGGLVLLVTFGGGLTWGATLLRW